MQKPIITLLCALGLAISAPAFSQTGIRSDAPTRYTVKQGDTLWSISKRYMRNPAKWSQLWGANKQNIKNPHRIYPGQVLVLTYVNGQPRLGVENSGAIPTVKLRPQAYEESNGYSIPTLPVGILHSFMKYPGVISTKEVYFSAQDSALKHPSKTDTADTKNAPRLVAGPDKRLMYSPGDRVYAQGIKQPGRYLVYRITGDIIDPDTHKLLGQEITYNGEVQTLTSRLGGPKIHRKDKDAPFLEEGERFTEHHPLIKVPTSMAQPMEVVKANSEMTEGNYLLRIPENSNERFNFIPHAPFASVKAKIIRIFDGVSEAGQNQTILLNKGERDGLDRGTVLSIYRTKHKVQMADNGITAKMKYLAIPAEDIGYAMVYHTSDHLAHAIIVESAVNVNVGDVATNPGLDMEDIDVATEHVPNGKTDLWK